MWSNGNSFSGSQGLDHGSGCNVNGSVLDPIRSIFAQVFAANEAAAIQRMGNLP